MTIEKALLLTDRLKRGIAHLSKLGSDGRRRTMRTDLLRLLRSIRTELRDDCVCPPKERHRHRKKVPKDPREEFIPIEPADARFVQIVSAGIRTKAAEVRVEGSTSGRTRRIFLAPRWAVEAPIGTTIAQLRKGKKSVQERKALMTLALLEKNEQL